MKEITIYQTEDGNRFDEKEDALRYEEIYNKCKEINSMLHSIDRPLKEYEYIQQDIKTVKKAFSDFVDLVRQAMPGYVKISTQEIVEKDPNYILYSNFKLDCLKKLSFRFSCISFDNGKEFYQPCFVMYQNETYQEVIINKYKQ